MRIAETHGNLLLTLKDQPLEKRTRSSVSLLYFVSLGAPGHISGSGALVAGVGVS